MLSLKEPRQLITEWNDTKRDYPRDKCIHELFEAQVERTPDSVAVVFEGQQLTYRELNRRANQLAHHLRKLGVGPEVPVGICVERSLEMVIGVLGILKAGGAYVPLDPAYPKERLAFMLEDTQAAVLLAQQHLAAKLISGVQSSIMSPQINCVCLDRDREIIARENETNPSSGVTADNLAYVIYTSGSTGKPKGVSVTHRGVVRLVKETNYAELTEGEIFLQFAPLSFDASTFEIWGSLLNGARLVVFPPSVPSLEELGQVIKQSKVTTLWLTSALFQSMVEDQMESLRSVKQLLAGGDVLSVSHVKKVLKELPGCRLINGYGPTENTTFTCCYQMTSPEQVGNSVPIGRPIANTQVYILDHHLNPVLIEVSGELYIGGDGLARSYFNSPDLTSEKFIPDPFSDEPGARLYKTGDMARYLPDGNIEFLGRVDQQVKIRGFRVELGEIETMLGQHPAVHQAVVLSRRDRPDNKRLAAYVVLDEGPAPTLSDLRHFLQERLPDYMVPSVFVFLDTLPLTPNGKLDRSALPLPDQKRPELSVPFVPPRTPIENTLVRIWSELLNLESVGIHDNFLDLGGHSLLATQAICRIRDTFKVELPFRSLFNSATVAKLAQTIENHGLGNESLQFTPIHPVPRDGDLPLSSPQQRVWFIQELEPENISYHFQAALRFTGLLNVTALEQSLSELVRRHEILRTTFASKHGSPFQVIHAAEPVRLSVVNLQPLPESERHDESQRLINNEIRKTFDLTQLPLIRWTLLRLSEKEHLLVHVEHHMLHDGWSFNVFVRELMEVYRAFSSGNPSPLPEMKIQFADFARWQQQWLRDETAKKQLDYWKENLAGSCLLELPSDRPRPAVQSFRGSAPRMDLPLHLCRRLRAFSRKQNVTLFMTMLTAFATLIYRYTGQVDFCVGSGVANRRWRDTEGLIGMIINNVVLRNDLSGDPTVRDLLGRLRDTTLEAFAHQDLPFEKIVEALHQKRDLSHNPIFQVMFSFHDAPMPEVDIPGLNIDLLVGLSNGSAKFDLNVIVIPHSNQRVGPRSEGQSDGLTLSWEYNTDLFDDPTMTRMMGHYQTLLESIVANPEQRLSDLSMLTDAEREQLLVGWNETHRDYPKDRCIHELFEEQVERSPDTVAVVFEAKKLTYRELNERANHFAHHLRKLGVGPDVIVGICMERSIEMVLGLLAILKAGGAYMPIDPDYPKDRVAFMLEDADAPVLLSQQRLIDRLAQHGVRAIPLDAEWEAIAHESKENPVSGVTAENLAYVIFTSGSTGTPKGAMNTHRGICNRLLWMQDAYQLTEADRVLQKTAFSFDVSVWEFFWPLLTGACLVVARPGDHQDSAYLVKLIAEQKITTLHFVPSMLQVFLEQEGLEILSCLRRVMCSGEALPFELQERFFFRLGAELHNLYGPTEASVDVTFWACKRESNRRSVPIGRPIANTQIYLLDSHLQPIPIGVPGELYIRGDGVARGYLNRPELTAEKFIPDPLSNDPGARLYKTGDLARHLPDGNIEFLGRSDHQVKIRGFRIELGEIEAVLSQHPTLKEAVVIAQEDMPGDPSAPLRTEKRLVAYVVSSQEPAATASELRGFLQQKLPEYMVPSAFVFLESLPLTPNGKIDRRALPLPDASRPELEEVFVAPRTRVEEVLAGIWAEVLKLKQVGIHDNFFDLGGHSLLAAQIVSRTREAFSVELPLRGLFEAPTVAGLARRIEAIRRDLPNPTSLPILPLPCEKECPLSFSQQRFWFLSRLEPDSFAYNNTYGFRLTGALNVEALKQALGEIVRRHEALRTTFCMRDGEPVQVIAEQWSVQLPIIDLSAAPAVDPDTEVQRLLDNEFRRPFNLSSDLMLRATLLRLDDDEHALLLTIHHIAWDHWSIQLLYRELSVIYKALTAGSFSPLPELPIQYRDYALWQQKVLQGAMLEDHLAYWRRRLSDSPPVLHLPVDYPRPSVQTFSGASQGLVLPEALADALKALSREIGATLFMTLLAAFKALLHRLTGQDDIVVGSPVAGRDRSETENLIGLFLNTLVLRTSLSGNPTFRELLIRVRDVALGAYDHRDLPFEKLVEELKPKRDLSHAPLFQVFFNMYNFEDPTLDLDGLSVKPLHITQPVSNFDLTLYVRGNDDATRLILVYNADLFRRDRMTWMLQQFRTLLESIAADPNQSLSTLRLLTETERHQLSQRGNAVRSNHPFIEFKKDNIEQTIPARFEQQVKQFPDHISIRTKDRQWTYTDLNRKANQVAETLRTSGGNGEERVGLLLEHDAPMVAGILGVLKAGKTYVPLDPSYPAERVVYLLEDSQATVLLTDSRNIALAKTLSNGTLRVINIDDIEDSLSIENLNLPMSVDALAYILYTSGSTGQPKGVMQSHRNVLGHIRNYTNNLHIDSHDRVTLISSYCFDAAVMDIFGALLNGAVLYPLNIKEEAPSSLALRMIQEKITIYHSTPTVYRYWIESLKDKKDLSTIRLVVLGGEEVQKQDVDLFKQHFAGHAILVNGLGPTESTVALQYFISHETEIPGMRVPVGYPVEDTEILLLNNAGEETEVYGEIAIRSPHNALGYWQRPELTKAAFLPDPKNAGRRIYRTGDMGYLLPNGSIEFVGRKDQQVKIRGFRIEPGEIESVLARHPGVRETVVLAREDAAGDKRLTGYVVPHKEQTITTSDLRNFLKSKLPDYMIPSLFVFLECLPLTANGKVDRRALPAPDQSRPELEESFLAPRTPVEKIVAQIWAEVLKLEKVGIHDNFFDLGGHSLLATQVVSRLRDGLRVELPLRTMFEKQTVEELAMVIAKIQVEKTEGDAVANILADIESLSDVEVEELVAKETVRIRNSRAG